MSKIRELLVGVMNAQAQLIEGLVCENESLEARLKGALSDVTYLEDRLVEARAALDKAVNKAVNQATAE